MTRTAARLLRFALAPLACVLLAAQAPADPPQEPPAGPGFEEICRLILEDRTELMSDCVAAEAEAYDLVMSWFGYYGLLTPEGVVDSFQLIEAENDPMRGLYETPASTASLCLDATRDWIGLSDCLSVFDQGSPGLGPGLDPGLGPDPYLGPDPFLQPGGP